MSKYSQKNILIILIILGLIAALLFTNDSNKNVSASTVNDEEINKQVNEFIRHLFAGDADKAGDTALGAVKFNVMANNTDYETQYAIKNINSETTFKADDMATVYSIIEFNDTHKNDHDLVFYEIKLLKENGAWKIFNLNETEPVLSNNPITDKKAIDAITDDSVNVFKDYTNALAAGDYNKAGDYLISKAKKMQSKANPAIQKLNIIGEITDISCNAIHTEENIFVSKIKYKNDNKPMTIIAYFYKTGEGWKIYNVNQI